MSKKGHPSLVLPGLRGIMGDWVYYSCLMSMGDLGKRVAFADDLHKNKKLSDMIQRSLKANRATQIAEYLRKQSERFFNSLVIATYGGAPDWYALDKLRRKRGKLDPSALDPEVIQSIGFLTLNGNEHLFALDGQHRLAGIKKALQHTPGANPNDEIPVILVAHDNSPKGLERTRRLFTTLNKTARPVSKGDIIALDEDDTMAICTRWLIERTALFDGDRIAFVASNNMPVTNSTSLTTIGNLYDVLTILFTQARTPLRRPKALLRFLRPKDEELQDYFALSKRFFELLGSHFKELGQFFQSSNPSTIVRRYRNPEGGSCLFRPIGLEILMQVIARLSTERKLENAVKLAARLPWNLADAPHSGLLWNPARRLMVNSNKVTLREMLLYMGGGKPKYSEKVLLQRYRKDMQDDSLGLPEKAF